MTFCRKSLTALIVFILAGCSGGFQSSDVENSPAALTDKAIVVATIHAPHQNLVLGETDSAVSSVWQNTDNPEIKYRFKGSGIFSSYWQPANLQEHMVIPGTYRLTSMTYKINGTEYKLSFSTHTNVTFTANAGEIVYAGDLQVLNAAGGDYSLKVSDHCAEAEKQILQDLPGLGKPVTKRLFNGVK